jgi:hypothetical protein
MPLLMTFIGTGLFVVGVATMIPSHFPTRTMREDSDRLPAISESTNSDSSKIAEPDQRQQIPPDSGHSYHAYEFIQNPNRDLGQIVELDPWSFPMLSRGFVVYQKLDRNFAAGAARIGLRFNRDLSDDTLLYDVMLNDLQGDFLQGTEFLSAGQMAVRMSRPGIDPDTLQMWDVEPLGTIEGTTAAGLVVRVPLVRFWRYHDSHLDASEPMHIEIQPQRYENGWSKSAGDSPTSGTGATASPELAGDFNIPAAMTELFGNYNLRARQTSVTVNDRATTDNGTVAVLVDKPFSDGAVRKHLLVTSTAIPQDQGHASGARVGAYLFAYRSGRWSVETRDANVVKFGAWGSPGTVTSLEFAPGIYGFSLEAVIKFE